MIPYSLATSDVELDAQLTVIVAFFMFSQYDLVVFLLIEQFAYSDIKFINETSLKGECIHYNFIKKKQLAQLIGIQPNRTEKT